MKTRAAKRRSLLWASVGAVALGGVAVSVFVSSSCERAAAQLPVPVPVAVPVIEDSAWISAESCQRKLASKRDARRSGVARLATWNIRWFPDGAHDPRDATRRSDIDWLACAIADLQVDVLAVQEFRVHARAVAASKQLISALNRLTGGDYRLELSKCGTENAPHLGFLYDAKRVRGLEFQEIAALNPEQNCTDDALPGFAGYLRFPGGLDLHAIAVHTWAGDSQGDFSKRQITYAAMPEVSEQRARRVADEDVVFLGDFNTSGCSECATKLAPEDELRLLEQKLRSALPNLKRVASDLGCSEYHDHKAWSYDHVFITSSARELEPNTLVHVGGYCEALHCRVEKILPKAESHLSDHCPMVLELLDRDLD